MLWGQSLGGPRSVFVGPGSPDGVPSQLVSGVSAPQDLEGCEHPSLAEPSPSVEPLVPLLAPLPPFVVEGGQPGVFPFLAAFLQAGSGGLGPGRGVELPSPCPEDLQETEE